MEYVWLTGDYKQAEVMIVAWAGPVPKFKEWIKANEDIHLNVAMMIAKVVQENKVKLPPTLDLFKTPWIALQKNSPERQVAKTTVHANNYGMGKTKFALVTGLPESVAELIQFLYFQLVPEIKSGYQVWIDTELRHSSTLVTPMGRRKIFFDMPGPERSRAAYSGYAQMTVGDMKTQWLCDSCEYFRSVKDLEIQTPETIRSCGLDVGLEMHDSLATRIPNDDFVIKGAALALKKTGEIPLVIKGEELIIPVEFKIGPNLKDLKEYVL